MCAHLNQDLGKTTIYQYIYGQHRIFQYFVYLNVEFG